MVLQTNTMKSRDISDLNVPLEPREDSSKEKYTALYDIHKSSIGFWVHLN